MTTVTNHLGYCVIIPFPEVLVQALVQLYNRELEPKTQLQPIQSSDYHSNVSPSDDAILSCLSPSPAPPSDAPGL